MFRLINGYRSDERGATATEYAMLIVFIALTIAAGAQVLGNGISGLFSNVAGVLTGVGSALPTP
jgi:pilus assembly protein Flp/PilA